MVDFPVPEGPEITKGWRNGRVEIEDEGDCVVLLAGFCAWCCCSFERNGSASESQTVSVGTPTLGTIVPK